MKDLQQYADRELLFLISQDKEPAFTEIYHRFWDKLFAVAYNRLKDLQLAEDTVHDVFAGLWANRKSAEIGCLENYLAVATKYAVFTKIKKRERERSLRTTGMEPLLAELPAENALHYKRILEIVHAEIERLPEKCRLIFKHSRQDGMSVRDIARELDISPKTVENQINKALRHLKLATRNFFHSFFSLF